MKKEERETVGKQKSNRWHGKQRKKKAYSVEWQPRRERSQQEGQFWIT